MTEFDPAPEPDQWWWQEGTDTFGRVYEVALGVTSPTHIRRLRSWQIAL